MVKGGFMLLYKNMYSKRKVFKNVVQKGILIILLFVCIDLLLLRTFLLGIGYRLKILTDNIAADIDNNDILIK